MHGIPGISRDSIRWSDREGPGAPPFETPPTFAERMSAARELADDARPDPVAILSGWCFLMCAAVAIGYGLWTLYGSGRTVSTLDLASAEGAASCPTFGPVSLTPEMNPLRAVLRTGFAPVGSLRLRYEIALNGPGGRTAWDKRGFLGSSDDDASIVSTTDRLLDFEVAQPGEYTIQALFPGGSMDDLREATIELRRNVARPNGRVVWGFALAAAASLAVSIVASRRTSAPYGAALDTRRDAA